MIELYITDLAAYNEGFLVGEFITLPKDETVLLEDIHRILGKGESLCQTFPHEEIFVTDYEWKEFPLFKIDEFEDIQALNKTLQFLEEEANECDFPKIEFLLDNSFAKTVEDAIEKLDSVIHYSNTSMEEIAEEYVENCIQLETLPELIRFAIDYEKIGRELELSGAYFQVGSDIFEYLE